VLGTGLRVAAGQGAQLIGFGVGGVVVAAIGSHAALFVDAVTFALSAIMIATGVHRRARPRQDGPGPVGSAWMEGSRVAFRTPYLRVLLALTWLAGVIIIPEGLAAPYAAAIGGGAGTVGLLLAANPAGLLVGTISFTRLLTPVGRSRAVGLMSILACMPAILLWSEPSLPFAMGLLALSGLACAYQTQVMTEFVVRIPQAQRGHAISIAAAGMLMAQGIGLIVGGALAQVWGVGPAISVCAAFGTVLAVVLAGRRSGAAAHDRLMEHAESLSSDEPRDGVATLT
jgi:predicted MFS family arabinose efflux permease